jgi:hypothetical protein
MSAILIAGIAVLVLAVIGLGYLWLVRAPRHAAYDAYQDPGWRTNTTHRISFSPDNKIEWR